VQADYEFLPSAAGADLKDLTECTGPTGILEHIPKAPPNAPEAESPVSSHHQNVDHNLYGLKCKATIFILLRCSSNIRKYTTEE